MGKTWAIILLALGAAGCGGGDTSPSLNCEAYCTALACDGEQCLANTCGCFESAFSPEVIEYENECSSKMTCGEVDDCHSNRPIPRPRRQEIEDTCQSLAARCGRDANACPLTADIIALYNDSLVDGYMDCWTKPCDDVDACVDGLSIPECL